MLQIHGLVRCNEEGEGTKWLPSFSDSEFPLMEEAGRMILPPASSSLQPCAVTPQGYCNPRIKFPELGVGWWIGRRGGKEMGKIFIYKKNSTFSTDGSLNPQQLGEWIKDVQAWFWNHDFYSDCGF